MAFRYVVLSEQHVRTLKQQIKSVAAGWCKDKLNMPEPQINISVRTHEERTADINTDESSDTAVSVQMGEALCSVDKHSAGLLWRALSNQGLSGRLQSDQLFIIKGTLSFLINQLCARKRDLSNFSPTDQAHKKGSGWLYGQMSIGDMVISLKLPPNVVVGLANMHLDASSSFAKQLTSRQDALLPSKAVVTASLGTTTIRLQDLQRLQVGDVLQVDTLLSDTLKLITPEGKYVVDAHLAMQEGSRALVLVNREAR